MEYPKLGETELQLDSYSYLIKLWFLGMGSNYWSCCPKGPLENSQPPQAVKYKTICCFLQIAH